MVVAVHSLDVYSVDFQISDFQISLRVDLKIEMNFITKSYGLNTASETTVWHSVGWFCWRRSATGAMASKDTVWLRGHWGSLRVMIIALTLLRRPLCGITRAGVR